VPALDGKTGGITAFSPPPNIAQRPSAKLPNWWTDDPSPEVAEGPHIGAKTVSRWREDFLSDFAARMDRCKTPATAETKPSLVTVSGADTKKLSTLGLPEGNTSGLHSVDGGEVNVDEIRVGTEGKDVAPATQLLTHENTTPLNLLLQYTPADEERAEKYKHYLTQELGDLVYGIKGTGTARTVTKTIVVLQRVLDSF
jgi:hypothetical protein